MDSQKFNDQIARLKRTYGDKAYPAERVKLMFVALKSMTDSQFESACDWFIANQRAAPMLQDFADDFADTERRNRDTDRGALELLREAEKNNTTADPEFVRACMETIEAKLSGRMPREQFWSEALPMIYSAAGIERELTDEPWVARKHNAK